MDEIEEEFEDRPSPIIELFERLSFERTHDIHDQVESMIELFSSSEITLEMLDILVECIKVLFVHPQFHKNSRIIDFLVSFTHVTHINYKRNKNLSLVFDTLIDIFSQMIIAFDSQIRHLTFRFLNQLKSFVDLVRSSVIPDQFELNLLDLLENENKLTVFDELLPLASEFQEKNPRFIDALLHRVQSPKWISYIDRRRQIISLLKYSPSSLSYLLSNLENENDFFRVSLECLVADERGFTFERLTDQGQMILWKIASQSKDYSRLILTSWINQSNHRLIDILQSSSITNFYEQRIVKDDFFIEKALRHFLSDDNHLHRIAQQIKTTIGSNKGALLPTDMTNFNEYLFVWRLLCQLLPEEEEADNNQQSNVHPDFHEFLSYFYRLIKSSINQSLSSEEEFLICQYSLILLTFDTLDMYRRKCFEAMGRCLLVHFGQYENIIEHALHFISLVHQSNENLPQRYQLITYTLNDLIQRCQTDRDEELTFSQCMTLIRMFIEHEKSFQSDQINFKQLIHSLIQSGLKHGHTDIQYQTLTTLHSLIIYSEALAMEYLPFIFHTLNQTEDPLLKPKCLAIFLDIILLHGLDVVKNLNIDDDTPMEFLEEYLLKLSSHRNIEMKKILVRRLMHLFLSFRLEPTMHLVQIILSHRFSNDDRTITKDERQEMTTFFYFFIHLSYSHVQLIEQLTTHLISHSLPFVSESSPMAYRTLLIDSMCSFCVELLSLPTVPEEKFNKEHSHYHLAKSLLETIHSNRTSFVMKSYLNIIKHLQFQYMTHEELNILLDLTHRLRQYPNLPVNVIHAIKSIEDHLQSSLDLINKLVNQRQTSHRHQDKRPRSPSTSTPIHPKRHALSPQRVPLQDRTNQPSVSKGIKRKLNSQRYGTLDFENETDDFF